MKFALEDEQLYQCCFCGHKFDEQDSLDFEWDKMIEDFAKKATPEKCLEWISIIGKDRKHLEENIGIGEFGFEQAFRFHFKINYKDCDKESYKKLKRDLTPYKTCQNCIRIRKKEYDNNKAKRVCEHNLYKYYCSICTKARREKNLTKVQDLEKKLLYKAISEKLVEFVAQQRQL